MSAARIGIHCHLGIPTGCVFVWVGEVAAAGVRRASGTKGLPRKR